MTRARDLANIADGTFTATDLDLSGTLTVSGDATFDTNTLFVDASANAVGIGTSSPDSPLTVKEVSNTAIHILKSAGTSILKIGEDGNNNAVYNATSAGAHIFQDNGSEAMRIDSSGNVGIGTNSPANSLEIQHGTVGTGNGSNNTLALRYNSTTLYGQHYMDASGVYHIRADAQGVAGGNLVLGADNTVRFYTGSTPTERARIDSSGTLIINDTAAGTAVFGSGKIHIDMDNTTNGVIAENHREGYTAFGCHAANNTGIRYALYIANGSATNVGSISYTSSGTSFNTSSDARLKENIADAESASSLVDAIKVRQFDWKADGSHQLYGMVAQELLEVAPEAVHQPENPDDMMGVDYSKLVPMLVKEIQSLRARVAQLEGA